MTKKIIKILILLILLIALVILVVNLSKKDKKFYLEDKYYEEAKINEIDENKLESLINNKESFVVFIYQPMCITSSSFNELLNEFTNKYNMTIYMIPFSSIKDTNLEKYVKYYPSFVIFNKGKVADYLEADSDDDTKCYENLPDFEDWFFSYVLLKYDNNGTTTTTTTSNPLSYTKDDVIIDNVTKEDDKVNIYFFYGKECPHCEEEFSFFDEIENEYSKYYNLYTFEVWHDEYNRNLLKIFSNAMGSEASAVPYTVIGVNVIRGFDESSKNAIKNAIKESYNNDYDVYFDKVLKEAK